jgi:hypothetical protein
MQQRLAHIMGLMRAGKYERGKTSEELAKRWDLGLPQVERLTAEASKLVAAEVTNADAVTADIGVYLRWVVAEARAGRKTARAGIQAAKVWSHILEKTGVYRPQEIHVTVAASATPASAKKAMEEAFGPLLGASNGDDAGAPRDVSDVSGAPQSPSPK